MSNNEKYKIKELSFDEMLNDLNNTSPLKMSKKLIEYELYDQQSSLEVLNQIYEEFESKQDVVDELVTPVFFNIADGLVKHPKLGLAKTGITASRLVDEIKSFSYEEVHSSKRDERQDKADLNDTEKNTIKDRKIPRSKVENKQAMEKYKEEHLKNGGKDEYTGNDVATNRPQPDHIVPLVHAVKEYGTSKFLDDKDFKEILNKDSNLAVTNGSLNQSKGGKTNIEAVSDGKNTISNQQNEATKQTMVEKEKEATKIVEKELNQKVGENLVSDVGNVLQGESKLVNDAGKQTIDSSKDKAMGEVIILIIKPLYYEFSDIFKNGILYGFDISDKIEAFTLRIKRVKDYILKSAVGTLFDSIKDFLQSFVIMIINGIVNAFIGLVKKILQVITQGFSAIVGAVNILMEDKITPLQKADAITKLLATTAITFLGAYFEESILGFMTGTPFEFLKDVIMIILTGVASTVIVWLIDQADLFSVKAEKRMMRVKEVFELRIQAIKENTDIFEKTSLEVLAKQKLQFKKIAENMQNAIEKNLDVNESVYEMANFMQIDLQIKSTDDFLHLLSTNKELHIA